MLTKQEILLGKGTRVESSRVREPRSTALWLAVSGFMVMELVSRLSLANHSDSESFMVVHALFSQDDAREDSGRWLDMWCLLLTFPKLPVGGLLVPCSLPGPPVIKQLMQMVTMVAAQGTVSVSVLPLTTPHLETSYSRYFLGIEVEVSFIL